MGLSEACDFHGCKLLNGRLHVYPRTLFEALVLVSCTCLRLYISIVNGSNPDTQEMYRFTMLLY